MRHSTVVFRGLATFLFSLGLVAIGSTRSVSAGSTPDGTLDAEATAAFGVGFDEAISALTLQPDGKILVVGDFTTYKGVAAKYIARLNSDGILDEAFQANLGAGFDGSIKDAVVQPDGKIVVVGGFDTVSGVSSARIARLNPNGSVDAAFSLATGTGFFGGFTCTCAPLPESVALQPDGNLVVGGDFAGFDGQSTTAVVRLNTSGSADVAFNTNSALIFDYAARSIAVQADGKILVAGAVAGGNSTPTPSSFVRLNSDGTLDISFNAALANGNGISGFDASAVAVALQADGKIIIGGNFSRPSGRASNLVARYSTEGTLDDDFSARYESGLSGKIDRYFYSMVTSLRLMPTGDVLAAGSFTTAGGIASPYFARITSTGEVDKAFSTNLGGGPNQLVNDVVALSDGRYLVAGAFTSFAQRSVGRIVVLGSAVPPSTTSSTTTAAPAVSTTTTPASADSTVGGSSTTTLVTTSTPARATAVVRQGTLSETGRNFPGSDGTLGVALIGFGVILRQLRRRCFLE